MNNIVFTAWNFFIRNLREGLSEYFGASSKIFYIGDSIPEGFWIIYPALVLGSFYHIYKRRSENKSPYLSYAIFFYLIVFSYIPHKEPRFMLPIYSFGVFLGGEITEIAFKRSNVDLRRFFSLFWVGYMVRQAVQLVEYREQQRGWIYDDYLANLDPPIHSLYTQEQFVSPHYSWFHGKGTKVRVAPGDPQFARLVYGDPLPIINKTPIARCITMLDQISSGEVRPEYVLLANEESEQQLSPAIGLEVCRITIESLRGENGEQLYYYDRWFPGELTHHDYRTGGRRLRDRLLFKLNPKFKPFMDDE